MNSATPSGPVQGNRSHSSPGERYAFWVIVALFLFLNLSTLTRLPKVWLDEVTDVDTAYNLITGRGFTSTAWFGAKSSEFYTFNPMYPLFLAGWFWTVGFGIIQSRLFDLVIVGLAAWIFYDALRLRHGPAQWLPRICLLSVVLFGDEFVRSYRGHRYDFLAILWFAALYRVAFVQNQRTRLWLTFLFSMLLPLTSFNSVSLSAIILGCLFLATRGRAIYYCLVAGSGVLAGLGLFLGLHLFHGTLGSLTALTTPFVDGSFEKDTFLQIAIKGIRASPSALLLAVGSMVILWSGRNLPRTCRHLLIAVLVATPGIPLLMAFIGRFSYFYAWTMVLPVTLLFSEACARLPTTSKPNWTGWGLLIGAILSVGLPFRAAVMVLEWNERDYQPIHDFVARHVSPDDVVLYDPPAYYPVKPRAKHAFVSYCLQGMTAIERRQVTLMILSNEEAEWRTSDWYERLFANFEGQWQLVDELVIPRSALRKCLSSPHEDSVYDVYVYRSTVTNTVP